MGIFCKDKVLTSKEVKDLEFVYDRLELVHGDKPNYDFMVKLKGIIKKLGNGM